MKNYRQSRLLESATDGHSSWRPVLDDEITSSLFTDYYGTFTRHKKLILVSAALVGLLGLLAHLTTQPTYRTRTSLDIQSVNSDFMNLHSVQANAATPIDTLVQTQIKLLQSDSLLDRVKENLTARPHPDFIVRNDLLSRIQRVLHLGGNQRVPYEDLLNETAAGVKIKPMGITQLVEITCDSWDAQFAASFCNTLTDQFREVDLESRGDQAKLTSDWLERQAADIRQKAQESEQRLIAATGGNGLILSQQAGGVGEDGLRSIQSELVRAQASRMEAEAQLETRRKLSNQGPISNESAAYSADKVRLADLQTQIAALVPPLTEENPRVLHLRSEIRQVETNLDKETLESDRKLQNDFDSARHREDLLTLAYRAQEGQVSSVLQKSSGVDLLRREVQSEQQLYETLLQRAKEAGFASAMPASTIRVVDAARAPRVPSLPQRLTGILIGIILGTFGGTAIALFKDRAAVLLRMPGDSERLINTDELGVIPSPLAAGVPYTFRNFRLPLRNVSPKLALGSQQALHTADWSDDFSLVAEAYRNTTLSLLNTEPTKRTRSYVIASPSAGEGKTTITCNIGIALSKARLRVVLIDGDLRKPSLHKAFSVANELGLRQILGGDPVSLADICQPTAFDRLSIIPAGAGDETTVELLHSGEFGSMMRELSKHFDVILVDTPPMLHLADARILAREVQGTILVFRSGITSKADALTARSMLSRDRINVVGSILNDFNPRLSGKYGYYNSYSAYRRHSEQEHAGVSS